MLQYIMKIKKWMQTSLFSVNVLKKIPELFGMN